MPPNILSLYMFISFDFLMLTNETFQMKGIEADKHDWHRWEHQRTQSESVAKGADALRSSISLSTPGGIGFGTCSSSRLSHVERLPPREVPQVARRGQVAHYPDYHWYGVSFFWRLVMQESMVLGTRRKVKLVTVDVTLTAVDLLVRLVEDKNLAGAEREPILQRCVENIRSHTAVAASLLVLQKV